LLVAFQFFGLLFGLDLLRRGQHVPYVRNRTGRIERVRSERVDPRLRALQPGADVFVRRVGYHFVHDDRIRGLFLRLRDKAQRLLVRVVRTLTHLVEVASCFVVECQVAKRRFGTIPRHAPQGTHVVIEKEVLVAIGGGLISCYLEPVNRAANVIVRLRHLMCSFLLESPSSSIFEGSVLLATGSW